MTAAEAIALVPAAIGWLVLAGVGAFALLVGLRILLEAIADRAARLVEPAQDLGLVAKFLAWQHLRDGKLEAHEVVEKFTWKARRHDRLERAIELLLAAFGESDAACLYTREQVVAYVNGLLTETRDAPYAGPRLSTALTPKRPRSELKPSDDGAEAPEGSL